MYIALFEALRFTILLLMLINCICIIGG